MSDFPFGFTPNPAGDGAQNPMDLSNLGAMLQQLGAMMQRAQQVPAGETDWETVRSAARAFIAQEPDPSPVDAQRERVRAAADLAALWLNAATEFPAPAQTASAWSRAEWLEATFEAWKPIVAPIAASMAASVQASAMAQPESLPEEMRAMIAPMLQMATQMSSMMAAQQIGTGLGSLAREVWGAADIGIPLTTDGAVALVVHNVEAFAAGHELSARDVETYLAVREAAAQRLFHAATWLRPRLHDAIAEYARGVGVDTNRLRELMADVDARDPQALMSALQGGNVELPLTPGQTAAVARVELLLALIEGWVDTVTEAAVAGRIGAAGALQEALRRRRAAGGPAERMFAQLIGLELRPRLLREAAAYWAALPATERDAKWAHPDFLPSRDELGSPPTQPFGE